MLELKQPRLQCPVTMPSVLLDLVYVMYKGKTKKLMITGVGIEKKDQRVTEKKKLQKL